jgi:DNA-binding NarL/FixJ family response regulator
VRVLIVDRHRVVADGLRLILEQHDDLRVVGIAGDAAAATPLAASTDPDLLLVDDWLPDATGPGLTATLRDRNPAIRALLLCAKPSRLLLAEAVSAGARGFLLRSRPAEELVDAVRRAAAGEMLLPAATLAELMAAPYGGMRLLDLLTPREHDVVRLLAAGLDNRRIAQRLAIGYVTVRSHLRNISSKLHAHSRLEVLARAAELGLIER